MITDPGRVPIGGRGWVGDGRRGASVAPDGTVDWYAAGGLTSTPELWRLLDQSGPAVRVGPVRETSAARRHLPAATMSYRRGTNVLETVTEGPGGRQVLVVDFLPKEGKPGLVRLVRALAGPVDVEVEVLTGPSRRPGGGSRRVAASGSRVLLDRLVVTAPTSFGPAPLDRDTERWRAIVRLDTDEEAVVTISSDEGAAHADIGPGPARRLLAETELTWRSWLAPLAYTGPYQEAVERALLSVGALTGPGGAPSGAGTTSLPRRVGSERAADDRWVRLRDAATAVQVLAGCGLADPAEAAEIWLRHTLSTAHLPWPAWFDPDGQPVPDADDLPLEGWRRAQPVLTGRPPTLDIGLIGPVTAVIGASMRGPGGWRNDPGPLSAAFDALADATDWAADHWREPDAGRWEIERPLRLYVAGRIELLSALDRMARRARAANPLDLRAAGWQQEGRDLLTWLESEAIAPDGGLRLDPASDEADAALLAVAWDGPWPALHPVVAATVDRILERLSSGPLLYRYSDRVADERAGPDHPDLEASLLAVRALAGLERWDEAHERMEAVIGLAGRGGTGLMAETADPVSGERYGNIPATAPALALAEAALALEPGPR